MEAGQQARVPEARWAVARCLRTLGRTDEALVLQQQLLKVVPDSPYVHAELAELYRTVGDQAAADRHAARSAELLAD